jgi:flavin reductase (DIM6/NTAB) family NADH-FMN oxidoreductase RutF
MLSFTPKEKPIPELFGLMLDAIGPRPIAFASTVDENGTPNLAPFSFFNAFGANPPIVVFSPARRGRDNTTKHTFENVKIVPEVVINVVNYAIVQQVNLTSSDYKKGINEFVKAGFTQLEADLVKPFRVAESPVQMECKVLNIIETGTEGAAGNLVICEVLKFHYKKEILNEKGQVDPDKIDLVGRMGRDFYVRASGNAVFTLGKPGMQPGIGVDALPDEIKLSKVLTGNDLGILGGMNNMPNKSEVLEFVKTSPFYRTLNSLGYGSEKFIEEKHLLAKKYIDLGKVSEALKLLLFNGE